MRCPKCNSHNPRLHPAVQDGGEVSICNDAFHSTGLPTSASLNRDADGNPVPLGIGVIGRKGVVQ